MKKKILIPTLIILTALSAALGYYFVRSNSSKQPFFTEEKFKVNYDFQTGAVPERLEQMRKDSIIADEDVKIEYYFHTYDKKKAAQLMGVLKKLNYTADYFVSADHSGTIIVSGLTIKMKPSDEIVTCWTKEMCKLGYKFDAEFEVWIIKREQN